VTLGRAYTTAATATCAREKMRGGEGIFFFLPSTKEEQERKGKSVRATSFFPPNWRIIQISRVIHYSIREEGLPYVIWQSIFPSLKNVNDDPALLHSPSPNSRISLK